MLRCMSSLDIIPCGLNIGLWTLDIGYWTLHSCEFPIGYCHKVKIGLTFTKIAADHTILWYHQKPYPCGLT